MTEAPIKFWSFSSLKESERCPYSIYLGRVAKSPKPAPREDSPLTRGEVVHKEAELFIRGQGPLTPALKKCAEDFERWQQAYSEGRVEVEQSWHFDKDWGRIDDDDPHKWDKTWLIVKCDGVEWIDEFSAEFADWKTGKSFGKEVAHTQQGQLYAIATFMTLPSLKTVKASFYYTDEGKVVPRIYARTMLPQLIERYTQRANRLLTMTTFPPKANKGNCKYCDWGVDNGTGACSYAVSSS